LAEEKPRLKYHYESLNAIAIAIKAIYPPFQADEFLKMTMDETWDDSQLKARCRKISTNLGVLLPREYQKALDILE
jgi:tricorn protease-like protein